MTKRRLKKFVLPTVYLITISVIFVGAILIGGSLKSVLSDGTEYDYVTNALTNDVQPVIKLENDKIIKPFANANVRVSKYFYNKDDEESKQKQSLIYYENTYMQNTGMLYIADEEFEVISVLDGKIKNIKEDAILGIIVEIEHNEKVSTIYQSLGKVNLKIGDSVKQGDVIGFSGKNQLENVTPNCLLFEIYQNGNLLNPEEFYEMNLEALFN